MLIPHGELRASSFLAELGVLHRVFRVFSGTLYYRSVDTPVSSVMFMGHAVGFSAASCS